jgi:hypothetical protein|tara:strand:- start:128 stop:334 length:207 start_codon:yes stop_codon:yes gene_type:complete
MREKRYSGQMWCRVKKIIILEPKGWSSMDAFNHEIISYDEFINRAAASTPKMAEMPSRRAAARMSKRI